MACCFGYYHCLTLDATGSVWSFGSSEYCQLGFTESSNLPRKIETLPTIKSISCGFFFSACLDYDGVVWTFGNNESCQLGVASTNIRVSEPQRVKLPYISSIHCGGRHMFCVDEKNHIWCYGRNDHGQLGLADPEIVLSTPLQHPIGEVADVACGSYYSIVITTKGEILVAGRGSVKSNVIRQFKAIQGLENENIISIACGYYHALFLNDEGSVFAITEKHTIGLPKISTWEKAVQVPGLYNIHTISCSFDHSLCVDENGNLITFGKELDNDSGEIFPIQMKLPQPVALTSQGGKSSIVKTIDGSIWGWTCNSNLQLITKEMTEDKRPFHQLPEEYSDIIALPFSSKQKSARK